MRGVTPTTREPAAPRPIALVGLMGAGKSAVARRAAARLGVAVAVLDERIEAAEGATVAELFARHGEAWYREREARELASALEAGAGVIDCGGGIVLHPAARETLARRCRTVWLEVSPAEAARRVAGDAGSRPLLAGGPAAPRLEALLAERAPLYLGVALARVPTDGRDPDAVAGGVLHALGEGG